MDKPPATAAPKLGETVRYWLGNRERTGRVCYVDDDSFDVRWNYGGEVGTDTVQVRSDDWGAGMSSKTTRPKYVIINDTDAPEPRMVCQWVPGVGYCYMDRRGPRHDGMRGHEATAIEAFGFRWSEDADGMTRFYLSDAPPTATYRDGEPRAWQSRAGDFEWRTLKAGAVQTLPAGEWDEQYRCFGGG